MSILETNFYKGEQGPQGPQGPEGPEGPAGGQDVQHDDTLSGNGSPENPLKALPSCAICEMTVNDVGADGYNKFVDALGDGKLICYWDNSVGWLICSDYDITVPSGFANFIGLYQTGLTGNETKIARRRLLFTTPGSAAWGNLVIESPSLPYLYIYPLIPDVVNNLSVSLNDSYYVYSGIRSYNIIGSPKKSRCRISFGLNCEIYPTSANTSLTGKIKLQLRDSDDVVIWEKESISGSFYNQNKSGSGIAVISAMLNSDSEVDLTTYSGNLKVQFGIKIDSGSLSYTTSNIKGCSGFLSIMSY